MNSARLHILRLTMVSVAFIMLFSSCKRQKETVTIDGPATPNFITRNLEENLLEYDWFSAKVATDTEINGEKLSFKTNLRMRKDSVIWMSISPALGIEVARMIVTPDSIKFIDKWNDKYYIGTHSFIEDRVNIDLDFETLQDLTVGNPILYNPNEKFKGNKDSDGYILTSKSKGKVRRAAGMQLTRRNAEEMEDSLIIDIDEKRYDRVLEKFETDEEQLILKRYWLDSESFKVVRVIISDLINLRSLEADYLEFSEIGDAKIPVKMHYEIIDEAQTAIFDMEFSRVKLDVPTSFPFRIPEKFEEIK